MESTAKTINAIITATGYNELRVDIIAGISATYNAAVAASAAVVAASAAGVSLATHLATAASVHGLPSGVNVFGSKQASGLRAEYAKVAATWTHTAGQHEAHAAGIAWANPFTNVYAVTDAVMLNGGDATFYVSQDWGTIYSTTGASKGLLIYNATAEISSMELHFIGIGN